MCELCKKEVETPIRFLRKQTNPDIDICTECADKLVQAGCKCVSLAYEAGESKIVVIE